MCTQIMDPSADMAPANTQPDFAETPDRANSTPAGHAALDHASPMIAPPTRGNRDEQLRCLIEAEEAANNLASIFFDGRTINRAACKKNLCFSNRTDKIYRKAEQFEKIATTLNDELNSWVPDTLRQAIMIFEYYEKLMSDDGSTDEIDSWVPNTRE